MAKDKLLFLKILCKCLNIAVIYVVLVQICVFVFANKCLFVKVSL